MSFSYQQSDIHSRYDVGRGVPQVATDELMACLRQNAPEQVRLVVDLGCGTGRFTAALWETFGAPVIGIEPALNMRSMAEARSDSALIQFVEGSAEQIPREDHSADIIFMSQVFHHLKNRVAALNEIGRVLNAGGRLFVRQATRENLDSYYYQQFFPEARAIDEHRVPSRRELLDVAHSCGFQSLAQDTLSHEIAATKDDYLEKISLRTYSDLEALSDEAFHRGLHAFRSHSRSVRDFPRFVSNDLFVLERQ